MTIHLSDAVGAKETEATSDVRSIVAEQTPLSDVRSVVAEETPFPSPFEERSRAAWRAWLSALASDAESAMAAALAYEALDGADRTLWLDALDQDAPQLSVPSVALYAPLLSVETDPERRARIWAAVRADETGLPRAAGRALRGVATNGDRIVVVVIPLYLRFVHVLAGRIHPHDGFVWVKRDPIVKDEDALRSSCELDGVVLESTPLKPVVEELAHAVLAHRRSGRSLPSALKPFADIFQPAFDSEQE
jgi:hypothetical protein